MNQPARTNRSARRTAILCAAITAVAVLFLTSAIALATLRTGRVAIDTIGEQRSGGDRVDALMLIRDVDTARQEAKLRLYLDPAGTLADNAGRFARTVRFDSSSETTAGTISAELGAATLISEFVTTFDRGDDVSYPFDRYRSTIWLSASLDDGTKIPIRVKFEAADSTYRYSAIDLTNNKTEPTFDLVVERSGLAKALAMIIVALMWAMTLAVAAVTWLVVTRAPWRLRSFEVLGWLAAMLFALIQLRGVAPGAPGFGTLFDFLGFFWAELVTATSLCLIVAILIRSELARGNPDAKHHRTTSSEEPYSNAEGRPIEPGAAIGVGGDQDESKLADLRPT